jgi:hypothetical protein
VRIGTLEMHCVNVMMVEMARGLFVYPAEMQLQAAVQVGSAVLAICGQGFHLEIEGSCRR